MRWKQSLGKKLFIFLFENSLALKCDDSFGHCAAFMWISEIDFKEKGKISISLFSPFIFFFSLVTSEAQKINIAQVRRKSLPRTQKTVHQNEIKFFLPSMCFFSSLASILFSYVFISTCFFHTAENISKNLHDTYSF